MYKSELKDHDRTNCISSYLWSNDLSSKTTFPSSTYLKVVWWHTKITQETLSFEKKKNYCDNDLNVTLQQDKILA